MSRFFQFMYQLRVSYFYGLSTLYILTTYIRITYMKHILKRQYGFGIKDLYNFYGISWFVLILLFLDYLFKFFNFGTTGHQPIESGPAIIECKIMRTFCIFIIDF